MGCMLYGISADLNTVPQGTSVRDEAADVADAPLRAVSAHGLTAWVGEIPHPLQDAQAALEFGRVIEAYHQHMTLIPMRYGCLFDDVPAALAHLNAQRHRYQRLLAELDGCVELSLRIPVANLRLESEADPVPGSELDSQQGAGVRSGRSYLFERKRRLAAEQARVSEAEALDERLAGLFRRRSIESGRFAGRAMLSVHYLVPREQAGQVDAVLRDASRRQAANAGSEPWLLSGPWPPYHFSALAEFPPAGTS